MTVTKKGLSIKLRKKPTDYSSVTIPCMYRDRRYVPSVKMKMASSSLDGLHQSFFKTLVYY